MIDGNVEGDLMTDFYSYFRSKGVLVIIPVILAFVLFCIIFIVLTFACLLVTYGKDTPNYLYTVITGHDPEIPTDFTGTWRTWIGIGGGVKEEFEVRDGVRDGKYVLYYDNGRKYVEGFYKNGKENGKWISWHRNGQKSTECFWKDGQEHGKKMEWDEKGNILSLTWKYEGRLVSKEEFKQLTASDAPNK
jgi:hypothetical protein